ncbi:bifunctional DNA primase/polymerase [Ruegeria sp. PrR005]|uniref:DNA primase/polymerase bifunctional N-terminal domain-containing protein n=1 Tax=Ruegeria sp. PrR005 TaxID=2706882 RepID=A0A6B2NVN6_9RHOB|nr:bifunctional DNA primase/polymerase [Ruegeria sp. PrR005]NDW46707.1 hypothetical protein [Ruegeria sp. PrR005]
MKANKQVGDAQPAEHGKPASVFDEIVRLSRAGFSLIPLGSGKDGKGPMIRFGNVGRLPVKRVIGPMKRVSSSCFGVRLAGIVVVDCDTCNVELVSALEARFGPSAVHVRTPRGFHLYYASDEPLRPKLRQEGLKVDIKCGPNSYVVGPGSVRPDGGRYLPTKGMLGETPLTTFPSRDPAPLRQDVPKGSRNSFLVQRAVQMVEAVASFQELLDNLLFIRDEECAHPETIQDREVEKIADWAWKCRLENRVYVERNSDFPVSRVVLDILRRLPSSSDAIALYIRLKDLHGHQPGRTFPLQWKRMCVTGHTDLSRRRFQGACGALMQAGVLQIAKYHSSGHSPRLYRLAHVREFTGNVRPLCGE